jgi:hypothetical protein
MASAQEKLSMVIKQNQATIIIVVGDRLKIMLAQVSPAQASRVKQALNQTSTTKSV